MKTAMENTKDQLQLLAVILLLIGPYLLLFYKKVGIRIRLLFISLIELFILCTLITLVFFGVETLIYAFYDYSIFAWLGVLLNLTIIFLSWIFQKGKIFVNKLRE